MTMTYPLSIFISSKMAELASERYALKDALQHYQIMGWIWEQDAGARPQTIRGTYFDEVEACDIYIGLFWLQYGQYTIEEYQHARQYNKPCLLYEKYIDLDQRDPQLKQFLDKVQAIDSPANLTVCRFNNAQELAKQVQKDVMQLLITRFRQRMDAPTQQSQMNAFSWQTFPRILTQKEQAQLAEILTHSHMMSGRQSRATIINMLPQDITLTISHSDIDRVDIVNTIQACCQYANGIESLLEALRFMEGDSLVMRQVEAFGKRIVYG